MQEPDRAAGLSDRTGLMFPDGQRVLGQYEDNRAAEAHDLIRITASVPGLLENL